MKEKSMTYQSILQSAMEEFGAFGYLQGSINRICKQCDIAKGTLYLYFKNKEELYLSCMQECYWQMEQGLSCIVEKCLQQSCLQKKLQAYFDEFLKLLWKNPVYGKLYGTVYFGISEPLLSQVYTIGNHLRQVNKNFLMAAFEGVSIQQNIDKQQAADILLEQCILLMARAHFEKGAHKPLDLAFLQESFRQRLDIFLYGVLENRAIKEVEF